MVGNDLGTRIFIVIRKNHRTLPAPANQTAILGIFENLQDAQKLQRSWEEYYQDSPYRDHHVFHIQGGLISTDGSRPPEIFEG